MKKSPRLTLHRETVAVLDRSPLAAAQGGDIELPPSQICLTTICVTKFCPFVTHFNTCAVGCTALP